jgi:hypothetical protein
VGERVAYALSKDGGGLPGDARAVDVSSRASKLLLEWIRSPRIDSTGQKGRVGSGLKA